jgi:hypothetical protein
MAIKRGIGAVSISFCLFLAIVTAASAKDVTLAWDPNSESNLAGYKLYYKTAISGAPYDGVDSLQGASPIDVGNVTTFTVLGLSDSKDYYFVVTAYNTEGLESGYSNEATTKATATLNQPPVADAGPDQTVGEGNTVTLIGLNSSDPDDGIATYRWQQISGSTVTLLDSSAAKTTFISPDVGVEGTVLTFQLTVTDQGGNQSTDECLVNVSWVNIPPYADAGPELSVNANDSVTLDGSASFDADDGIASYLWTQTAGTSVSLTNPSSAQPSFVAPNPGAQGESLEFTLTVTDSHGLKDTDTCIVSVLGSTDDPPLAEAGPDQTVTEGETVLLDGSASTDSDDGIVSYQWNQAEGPPTVIDDPAAVQPHFSAPEVAYDGEPLVFQLTVTDKSGLKSSDKCNVSVKKASVAPAVSSIDLTGYWTPFSLSRSTKGKGDWIQGEFNVINNEGGQQIPSVAVRFYLSFDNVFDAADVLVGNYIVKNVAVGEPVKVPVQLKDKLLGADHPVYIIVEIDAGNSIPESSEENNVIILDNPL